MSDFYTLLTQGRWIELLAKQGDANFDRAVKWAEEAGVSLANSVPVTRMMPIQLTYDFSASRRGWYVSGRTDEGLLVVGSLRMRDNSSPLMSRGRPGMAVYELNFDPADCTLATPCEGMRDHACEDGWGDEDDYDDSEYCAACDHGSCDICENDGDWCSYHEEAHGTY